MKNIEENKDEKIEKKEIITPIKRKTVREYAFALIYEKLISGERNEFSKKIAGEKLGEQVVFFEKLLSRVDDNWDFLLEVVARFSSGYKIERIYKVDLSLILLASSEILFLDEIPDLVALNEALELAKLYSGDKSSKFIHGVLSGVLDKKQDLIKELKE